RLKELTLTTNGTRLAQFAAELADCGVKRINVSLDSLNPEVFRRLTRGGDLELVLEGIDAAQAAGLHVKINTVALKADTAGEIPQIIAGAQGGGMDLSLIEPMPLGEIEQDRTEQYLPLSAVREALEARWTLSEIPDRTSGPSRYVRVEETGGRL